MNADQRKALKLARNQIAAGSTGFICFALANVAFNHPRLREATAQLTRHIEQQLSPADTLGVWQLQNGIEHEAAERRADRLAWIDWMLAE